MPFSAVVDLDEIAAGTGGFKIQGENAGDNAGGSVSGAGDVNGDGIADLIVGAFLNDSGGYDAGAAYVVFGATGGFVTPIDLDDIATGVGGFKIEAESAGDRAGQWVSDAGDVNGDGIEDLIIGAPSTGPGDDYVGAAYVVFGTTSGFAALLDLDDIGAGTGGFKIQGENEFDFAGRSVSSAGDINGDGIGDLVVGAPYDNDGGRFAGAAYVVFGTTERIVTLVNLGDVAAGTGGFKLLGENENDLAGYSASGAGDVNGDGIDDLIVGSAGYDNNGYNAGAYVVFGTTGGHASLVDLEDIAAGSGGFKIEGENAGDFAGLSVSDAGDINGDGRGDLLVSAHYNDSNDLDTFRAGAAYVVFGTKGGFATPIDLETIAAGTGGFKIAGENENDRAGFPVSGAGDVNGDGIDDLIVGGYHAGGANAGAAYVVFGTTRGFATPVDLDEVAAGTGGFKIQGQNAYDYAGVSVSAAGDINGDGIDDLIIGAPRNNSGGDDAGAAYVIFGRRDEPLTLFTDGGDDRDLNNFDLSLFPGALATDALAGHDTVVLSETENLGVLFDGNAGSDTITGSSHRDRVRGGEGDDILRGNRGWDQLEGGYGDDTIFGGVGDDRIVGQWGSNQLWGGDGADTFVCGGSPGLETVNDFEVGTDKVEVRSQGRGVDVTFDAGSDATLISLDGLGAIVQLLGVEADVGNLVVV